LSDTDPSAPDAVQPPDGYLDLYKLAVEMADRVSARRGLANTFFLTVNTAATGVLAVRSAGWYLAAAGIVLSIAWWVQLRSYRELNGAKFEVILEMEKRLPAHIYTDEWARLKASRAQPATGQPANRMLAWLRKYRELGQAERIVPWVFALIYVAQIAVHASR
jgi:hypothetical protein